MDIIAYSVLFWLFILCSILGTLFEGVFCLLRYGRWETHTVAVYGPFCIIYGIGALVLYVGAILTANAGTVTQFIVFALSTTAVEYIGGLLLKHGLHMRAWDYSKCVLNLHGLICAKMTAAWGVLGVLFARYCVPYIKLAAKAMRGTFIRAVTYISSLLMALDLILTAQCIVRWARRHRGYPPRNSVEEYLDAKYNDEWMARRFCEWRFLDPCDAQ